MNLSHNIQKTQQLINKTELACHRATGSVLLVAVSKQQNTESISRAYEQGITHFGENYFQEAQNKINQLKHLNINWHFIGPIQSNKTKEIAAHFSWVHSIDRIKVARLLNQHRPLTLPPLNVCLQISLIAEPNKSGIDRDRAFELAAEVSQLPHLRLRGLMTIPPQQLTPHKQYETFIELTHLMHALNQQLDLGMDTLSMGMSDDFVPAIKAGSTLVRIGRAIFGERT